MHHSNIHSLWPPPFLWHPPIATSSNSTYSIPCLFLSPDRSEYLVAIILAVQWYHRLFQIQFKSVVGFAKGISSVRSLPNINDTSYLNTVPSEIYISSRNSFYHYCRYPSWRKRIPASSEFPKWATNKKPRDRRLKWEHVSYIDSLRSSSSCQFKKFQEIFDVRNSRL